MPTGPPLGINGQLSAFIGPGAELAAWPSTLRDIDIQRCATADPPMASERQRRALDTPSQQPATEVAIKAAKGVEVDRAPVDPHALNGLPLTGGTQSKKRRLIHESKPVVHIALGCAISATYARSRRPDCHGSARDQGGRIRAYAECGVHLVTEGEAARISVGLGGVEPVHHIRVTDSGLQVDERKGSA